MKTKTIYRSFLPHQYEKEATFLTSMSKKGWKFIKIKLGIPTRYVFEKRDEEALFYQLDYVTKEEDTLDYHQLFLDAGWKEVYSLNGLYNGKWYYFCKTLANNTVEPIYTDNSSKIAMYKKLLKHWGLFTLCLIGCLFNSIRISYIGFIDEQLFTPDWFFRLSMFTLFSLTGIIYFYMISGLVCKIVSLSKNKKNRKAL